MKPTRSQIEKAVRTKYRLTDDQIALHKTCGFWYWVGDVTIDADERCTFLTQLNEISLERWVEDFEYRILPFIRNK